LNNFQHNYDAHTTEECLSTSPYKYNRNAIAKEVLQVSTEIW